MKKVLLAILLTVIVEGLLYFFFAFCCWDLNWMPTVDGITRFSYIYLVIVIPVVIVFNKND